MWSFTEETELPLTPQFPKIPEAHIQLLDDFFVITDAITAKPEASEGFRDIFTVDGVWKTPMATYTGHDELSQSGTLWTALRTMKSMRHWVSKIYLNDAEAKDMMVLGRIRMEDLEGNVHDVNFGARVIFGLDETPGINTPRMKFFQGWSSAQ